MQNPRFTTGLQFLDKSTLGYAAIFGIIQDTVSTPWTAARADRPEP